MVTLASILLKLSCGQTRFLLICAVLALFLGPNDLEGQGQIPPYTIPSETYMLCTYWCNLVNLDSIFQKLLCGQARFFANFDLFYPNDLEGQGQITPQTIPTENFPRYTCKPNLVILAHFLPLGQYGLGVLLSPASVRLSVRPSVCRPSTFCLYSR